MAKIITTVILIAACLLSCYSPERRYYEKLSERYAGIIVGKYDDKRGWGCFLADSAGNKVQAPIGDKNIFEKADIGDTIKKLANSNKCLLIKDGKTYTYNCYYIPPKMRAKLGEISEW